MSHKDPFYSHGFTGCLGVGIGCGGDVSYETGRINFPSYQGGSGGGVDMYEKRLRDYFAVHCDVSLYNPQQTLESKLDRSATIKELADFIAEIKLIEADAMLAERAK